jgi:hypothetical protein
LGSLIEQRLHFGVSAPVFAWWAALIALLFAGSVLLWLFVRVFAFNRRFSRVGRRLSELAGERGLPGQGLEPDRFGELETAFASTPDLLIG